MAQQDRDTRLTDVVDAVPQHDDDPIGMRVRIGDNIGGYVVEGEIGHGGMGVVYSATHPVIRKRAAIKVLRPDVSRSPIAVERFIQEARAVNQIGHPNIVDIFAYGALPDGRAYHIMDLLAGESLRRRLRRGVLHPSEAASVIDEIASALMAAHDHGFVHRDLKPDNVFLVQRDSRWPEVKLLDFGLAKLMPEYGVSAFTTKTGVMLGTPEYMSPEQARGTGVDYRTDIYALGIVMFEILAGERPFPVLADPLASLLQHAEEKPASLRDVVHGLPTEMAELVDAMLAKTTVARPSLAAVRAVIKRLRTTQLPTRSLAGAPMPVRSNAPASDTVSLAVTASHLGAQVVLPDVAPGRPQVTALGVGLDAQGKNPNAPRATATAAQPLPAERARAPSQASPYAGQPRPHSPSQPNFPPAEALRAPSQPPPYAGQPRPHSPSQSAFPQEPPAITAVDHPRSPSQPPFQAPTARAHSQSVPPPVDHPRSPSQPPPYAGQPRAHSPSQAVPPAGTQAPGFDSGRSALPSSAAPVRAPLAQVTLLDRSRSPSQSSLSSSTPRPAQVTLLEHARAPSQPLGAVAASPAQGQPAQLASPSGRARAASQIAGSQPRAAPSVPPQIAQPRSPSQPPRSSGETPSGIGKLPPTLLGVGAPVKPRAVAPPANRRWLWVTLAVLLTVGGGIALTLVLTGG